MLKKIKVYSQKLFTIKLNTNFDLCKASGNNISYHYGPVTVLKRKQAALTPCFAVYSHP